MSDIINLIKDYQETARIGVEQFKNEFNTNEILAGWMERKFPQEGTLNTGTMYYFHGVGCLFTVGGIDVDVDFGPDNRSDGFDLWRLSCFVDEKKEKYEIYSHNKELLEKHFNMLENDNVIFKSDVWPGSTLYYFKDQKINFR